MSDELAIKRLDDEDNDSYEVTPRYPIIRKDGWTRAQAVRRSAVFDLFVRKGLTSVAEITRAIATPTKKNGDPNPYYLVNNSTGMPYSVVTIKKDMDAVFEYLGSSQKQMASAVLTRQLYEIRQMKSLIRKRMNEYPDNSRWVSEWRQVLQHEADLTGANAPKKQEVRVDVYDTAAENAQQKLNAFLDTISNAMQIEEGQYEIVVDKKEDEVDVE